MTDWPAWVVAHKALPTSDWYAALHATPEFEPTYPPLLQEVYRLGAIWVESKRDADYRAYAAASRAWCRS